MEFDDELILWCGNLSPEVEEDTLYELFLQVAPLNRVQIISQTKIGKPTNYGFITVKHRISVDYVADIMNGVHLYGKPIVLRARVGNKNNDDGRRSYNNETHRSRNVNNDRGYNNETTPRNDLTPRKNINNELGHFNSDVTIDQLVNLAPRLMGPNIMYSNYNNSPQTGVDLRNQIDEYRNYNDNTKSRHHNSKDNHDDYRNRNNDRYHKDDYRSRNDYKRNDRRDDQRNHHGRNGHDNKRDHHRRGNYKPYQRR